MQELLYAAAIYLLVVTVMKRDRTHMFTEFPATLEDGPSTGMGRWLCSDARRSNHHQRHVICLGEA